MSTQALAERANVNWALVKAAESGEVIEQRALGAILLVLELKDASSLKDLPEGKAATRLRDRRIAAGLSQREVGNRAALSQMLVRFLETCRVPFTRAAVVKLLSVPELGLQWEDFDGLMLGPRPLNLGPAADDQELRVVQQLRAILERPDASFCRECGGLGIVKVTEVPTVPKQPPPKRWLLWLETGLVQSMFMALGRGDKYLVDKEKTYLLGPIADGEDLRSAGRQSITKFQALFRLKIVTLSPESGDYRRLVLNRKGRASYDARKVWCRDA